MALLGSGVGFAYHVLDRRIDGVDHRIERLEDRIDKLDDRLRNVESGIEGIRIDLKYRPSAAALGLHNPDIKLVNLAPQITFTTRVATAEGPSFDLTYTILEITGDQQIVFRVDGRVGPNVFRNNTFRVPLKKGALTPLNFISGPGIPRLYAAVLDSPSPGQAVVAVGEMTSRRG